MMLTVNRVINIIVKKNARRGMLIDCRCLTTAINDRSNPNRSIGFVPGTLSRFIARIGAVQKGASMRKTDRAISRLISKLSDASLDGHPAFAG
jgi:hypothetical protein